MAKGKYFPTADAKAPVRQKDVSAPGMPRLWRSPDTGAQMGPQGQWAGSTTPDLGGLVRAARGLGRYEEGKAVFGAGRHAVSDAVSDGVGTAMSHTDAMRSHTLTDVHYASDRMGPGSMTALPRTTPIDAESWEHGDGPAPSWTSRTRAAAPTVGVLGGVAAPRALGVGTVPKPKSAGGPPPSAPSGDSPTNIDMRTPEGRAAWAAIGVDPKNIHVKPK